MSIYEILAIMYSISLLLFLISIHALFLAVVISDIKNQREEQRKEEERKEKEEHRKIYYYDY